MNNISSILKICIPHTHRDYFDYYSDHHTPPTGARVWVPFRNKRRVGLVIGEGAPECIGRSLKPIEAMIDNEPLISSHLLSLCLWVSHYYQSPLSEVLPLALPKAYREGRPATLQAHTYYELHTAPEKAHAQIASSAFRQHALIDWLAEAISATRKDMIQAGFKPAQIKALYHAGLLKSEEKMFRPAPLIQADTVIPPSLNSEQKAAVETISRHLDAYRCFLLQGVTGSGKTEVYLHSIAKILDAEKQVLVLVPEIGLTPQLLARFRARITTHMVVLHSQLSAQARQEAWQLASNGHARLVIGTRSAVFTPLPDLGLIILDEEHDASLKQMEGVRYSARDTALMRAHQANIPIILGSATPSLESLHNCKRQKYHRLLLQQKAVSQQPLRYQIMDIRHQTLYQGLAGPTIQLIDQHLKQNNQILIFINRRGFAPVLLCHECGWMADCRACDSHLTLHKQRAQLICHHCGLFQSYPSHCKQCHSKALIPIGFGTQRIHEYLTTQFPSATVIRIDRDEVRQADKFEQHLESIYQGEANLIVGTQMLAKGHHFPRLTLVVIPDADNGFYNQDFRALERLGQLLTQVAGRAGREERAGEVIIQTHLPQHPLLNLLVQQGYDAFAEHLLTLRQKAALPPFQFTALIRAKGKNRQHVLEGLSRIQEQLQTFSLTTLGPAPAPLARKADHHRMQLLVKSPSRRTLHAALTTLRQWLNKHTLRGVHWNIDVDPIDLT